MQKIPSWMLDRVLNTPLELIKISEISSYLGRDSSVHEQQHDRFDSVTFFTNVFFFQPHYPDSVSFN